MYSVKEVFYSIQGEGRWAGKPAVFCRFVGCNLWSGLEKDREEAECKICDTDFLNGIKISLNILVDMIKNVAGSCKFVVFTGGEPFLQLDNNLVLALQTGGFFVSVETNGTVMPKCEADWITLSPKTVNVVLSEADEIKLLFPPLFDYSKLNVETSIKYVQPVWCSDYKDNLVAAIEYVKVNPDYSLSLQTHKIIEVE